VLSHAGAVTVPRRNRLKDVTAANKNHPPGSANVVKSVVIEKSGVPEIRSGRGFLTGAS